MAGNGGPETCTRVESEEKFGSDVSISFLLIGII